MVLDLKAKIIAILGIILVVGSLFTLWRVTAIKLNYARQELTETTCKLDEITKENTRLVEYNKQRNSQIKQLEKSYQQKLDAIPADICGDTKPSKELLQYLRSGIDEQKDSFIHLFGIKWLF